MKKTILTILAINLCFATSHAAQQYITLNCKNVAKSKITATINVNQSAMRIKIGAEGDNSSIERSIKNKEITLNSVSKNSEATVYEGSFLDNNYNNDYRSIRISLANAEIKKDSDVRMSFQISYPHGEDQDPETFVGYGMVCEK